jgi:hypothetical protein
LFKNKNRFLGEWVFNKNVNYVKGINHVNVNYTGRFIKNAQFIEFKETTLLYF